MEQDKYLVMDSGGFIRGFHHIDEFCTKYKMFCLPEVVAEIKDRKTRDKIESAFLPIQLDKRPHPEALARVVEFSKATGDFAFLSSVDILVIALAVSLEMEKNGTKFLKNPPKGPKIVMASPNHPHPSSIAPSNLPGWGEFGKPETTNQQNKEDDVEKETTGQEVTDTTDEKTEEAPIETSKPVEEIKPSLEESTSAQSFDKEEDFEEEDEEDDEGWVNFDNFQQLMYPSGEASQVEEERVFVACCTTDFAMQNVLLQMGVNILSVDGFQIRHVNNWVLQCHICYKVCSNREKVFCPSCGNQSLRKISIYIDANGEVKYGQPRRQLTARGTRYSLPKPKSGRCNQPFGTGPIISEFQWERQFHHGSNSNSVDPMNIFDSDTFSQKKRPTSTTMSSRKNPNQVRRTTDKNKRNRRRK